MQELNEKSKEFQELERKWYEEIETLTTKSKYNAFVNKLNSAYAHDFGTSLRALACIVCATIRFYGGGLAPIQANYLMWQIIRKTFGIDDKIGMQLVLYEKLLNFDDESEFELVIEKGQHETLVDMAKARLESGETIDEKSKEHLEKIVKGWLPFGIKIKGEKGGNA